MVFALSLLATIGMAAYLTHVARAPDWHALVVLLIGLVVSCILSGIVRAALRARTIDVTELNRTQEALARHAERLRILHEIDRALLTEDAPEAIAGAVLQPLRRLLGVPRAIVNIFDLAAQEVEWLAAAGRRRVHLGPGVRYSMRLMGDVEALRRGEPQVIDTHALPPGPEVEALLASGVHMYMVVPMIAGGELIGALSFGGAPGPFPDEQISIAREAAAQLAIVMTQARLHERVKRQAEELELRVCERTQELRTAHAELMAAKERAEASDRLKSDFLAGMSHELRTPLNAIIGFTGVLLMQLPGPLTPDQETQLRTVESGAKHLLALINDLLDVAKIEAGKIELHLEPVVCQHVMEEVATALRSLAEGKGLRLEVCAPPAEVVVQTDRRALSQILINLTSNGIKFTDQGRVRLELMVRQEANRTLTEISVVDTGIGIRPEDQALLFAAFVQVRSGSQPRSEGTGLGLHLCQKLAALLGGHITLHSEYGKGSRFTLVF
jgi:signal transduction histidine kinase